MGTKSLFATIVMKDFGRKYCIYFYTCKPEKSLNKLYIIMFNIGKGTRERNAFTAGGNAGLSPFSWNSI